MQQMQKKWHKNNKWKKCFCGKFNLLPLFFGAVKRYQDEMPKNSHSQFDKGKGGKYVCLSENVMRWPRDRGKLFPLNVLEVFDSFKLKEQKGKRKN